MIIDFQGIKRNGECFGLGYARSWVSFAVVSADVHDHLCGTVHIKGALTGDITTHPGLLGTVSVHGGLTGKVTINPC